MKHQYFGDNKDLFKYDLMTVLNKDLKLDGITIVPMLTENDETNDGNDRIHKKAKAGTKNYKLIQFLEQFVDKNTRNINELKKHFDDIQIQFKFSSDSIFSHKERDKYFSKITLSNLKNEHLFFDPDNGLEIKKSSHKHILYSDVAKCFSSIDDNSIISIIQFKPRVKWDIIIPKKMDELTKQVTPHVTYIANSKVAFFILAKNKKRLDEIQKSLDSYKTNYQSLITK
jgi:hypothetical protein